MRLRVRRGRRRHRLQGRRGQHHQAGREQRHRRHEQRLGRRDLRPVGVRRQDGRACGCATPTDGASAGSGFFADDITLTVGQRRPSSPTAPRPAPNGWTADGLHRRRRDDDAGLRALLHRVVPGVHLVRHVPEDRPVQLRVRQQLPRHGGALPVPATACSSRTGTPRSGTTTRASTPARASSSPSTRTRSRCCATTARRGAVASRSTTRRSRRSGPTGSGCTSTACTNKIPSQKAQPVFDDARTYWYASAPTAGVKVPDAGVRITVLKQNKTTMTIQVSKSKG